MSVGGGGVRPWVVQRVSAVYLGFYVIAFAATLMLSPVVDFVDWRERLSQPGINVATLLFVFALLAHAWVGLRDVIMDYVHSAALRFGLLSAIAIYFSAMAVWAMRILAGLW
ncbi:MAG: succinate dehydrogenase, hydrophobic membrane anchor protein [Pseudomonadota bacterium]